MGTWEGGIQTGLAKTDAEIITLIDNNEKLEVLDNHEATGTESSHTLTKELSNDVYSKIIVVIDGEITATMDLEMVINSIEGTANYSRGSNSNGITRVEISHASHDAMVICPSETLTSSDMQFGGKVEIYMNDVNKNDILAISDISDVANPRENHFACIVGDTDTTIHSIKIQTSTSTWKAGTKITIYGLRRS